MRTTHVQTYLLLFQMTTLPRNFQLILLEKMLVGHAAVLQNLQAAAVRVHFIHSDSGWATSSISNHPLQAASSQLFPTRNTLSETGQSGYLSSLGPFNTLTPHASAFSKHLSTNHEPLTI
jgi:hypothetical protein